MTIYEVGNFEGRWFIAMEHIAGEPLNARIGRGPIPVPESLSVVEQVAAALSETHKQGILHRDIKPANIMLRSDGIVKLLDFGIAQVDPVLFEAARLHIPESCSARRPTCLRNKRRDFNSTPEAICGASAPYFTR